MEKRKRSNINYNENVLFGNDEDFFKLVNKNRRTSSSTSSTTKQLIKNQNDKTRLKQNDQEPEEIQIKQEIFENENCESESDESVDEEKDETIFDEIIILKNNTEILQLDSFQFLKSFRSNNIHYWQCIEKSKENCSGCVITKYDEENKKHKIMKINQIHNHDLFSSADLDECSKSVFNDNQFQEESKINIGDRCEYIKYLQGYLKIFINGNIYYSSGTRDDIFYWQCDQDKDCISQAITILDNGQHFLKSLDEHNHSKEILIKDSNDDEFLQNSYENLYEKCEFHLTSNSELKLYRNGYYYRSRNNINSKYYWKCTNSSCKAILITKLVNNCHYVKSYNEHNHENKINDEIDLNKYVKEDDYVDDKFENDESEFDNSYIYDCNEEGLLPVAVNNIKSEDDETDDSSDDEKNVIKNNINESKFVNKVNGEVECKFTITNRGNPKLCVNGYYYTKNRNSSSSYYWTCEYKRNNKCYGYVCTELKNGIHYLRRQREHTHPPHESRIHVMNLMERIKQRISSEPELSAKIIATEEYENTPEEHRNEIPALDRIIKLTQRKRRYEKECAFGKPENAGKKEYRAPIKKLKLEINNDNSIVDGTVCEIVDSQRGNGKLIAENYLYTLNRASGDCFSWRCEERGKLNCHSCCTTQLINGVHYLKTVRDHNHDPSPNRQKIIRALTIMKEKSLMSNDSASEVIKSELALITDEELLKDFPKESSMVRMINRYRVVNGHSISDLKTEPIDDDDHYFDINMMIGSECDLFAPTNKGNLKLNLNGFYYHKNRIKNNLHYWQCEENRTLMCKGFAITICNEDNKHYLKSFKCHNHTPKELRGDIIAIVERIKDKARNTEDDPSIIWNDEVASLPDDIKTMMPQRTAIMNMINRIRRPNLLKKETIEFDDDHEHIYAVSQQPETECEFVKSTKGNDKLTIEGYLFVRNKVYNNIWRWRCDENKKKEKGNCRGYAMTEVRDGKHILKKTQNHNHPANAYRLEIANAVNRMKERARVDESISAFKILEEETANLPENIRYLLPSQEAISSLIRRHRRKFYEPQSFQQKPQSKLGPLENHVHEPFVEPGAEVEFITCHKGTQKLNLNGYLFVKNSVKNNVHYWRCEEKHCSQCRGHATTIEEADGKHYLRTTQPHNHLAKVGDQKEINNVLNKIKELALNSSEGPAKIYAQVINDLPKDLKAVLPSRDAITMIIKRHRKKYRPLDKSALTPAKVYPPEVVEVIDKMKQKILKTTEGPAKIYNAEIANVPYTVREKMPKRENVLQALKRVRRKSRLKALKSGEIADVNESEDDIDTDDEKNDSTETPPNLKVEGLGHQIFKVEREEQNSSSSHFILPANSILPSAQILNTHFLGANAPSNVVNFWEHSKNFPQNS